MNKKISSLLAVMFLFACSHNVKKSDLNKNYEVEIVQAEGSAPIVNGDLEGAKKSSLNDAMKNALALVIGVYVSGDTLVSKSVLIDDNITSRSEGYIEKYKVLKEYRDGDFYKTMVEAHVRKEDLSAKLKNLETDVERIGNPVIMLKIDETAGGNDTKASFAANQLISQLRGDGFRISQSTDNADIVASGKADTKFNTKDGMGGFTSYSAALSLQLSNPAGEVIGAVNGSAGGIGLNDETAARESLANVSKKIYEQFKESVMSYYKEKRIVAFSASGVKDINQVNDLIKYFRNIPVIKDSVLKNFSGGQAKLEILMRKGNSNDIMPVLSRSDKFSIVKSTPFEVDVEMK